MWIVNWIVIIVGIFKGGLLKGPNGVVAITAKYFGFLWLTFEFF